MIAGLASAMIIAVIDLLFLSSQSEQTLSATVLSLNVALHLAGGLGVGLAWWSVSIVLGGWTLDQSAQSIAGLFNPIRSERAQKAAKLSSFIISVATAAALMFLLNLRFMAFNNQSLAALLLVVAAFGVWLFSMALHQVLQRGLGRVIEWISLKLPMVGDSPLVWTGALIGLFLGSAAAAAGVHWLVVIETWEALTLGPLLGLCTLLLVAALLETFLRSWQPMAQWLGLALCTITLVSWGTALGLGPITGDDNRELHQNTWVVGLHLGVAEKLTDRDHDGFSPLFGHGDCNDLDPSAWPGSPDGDDCLPDVSLVDAERFTLRLRGPATSKKRTVSTKKQPVAGPSRQETPEGQAKDKAARPPNILLITMDTVRADHVGFGGYERNTTPKLDALARESVIYERAYAPSNLTPAAVPSMLSGLYPTELWRDDSHFIRFEERNVFVAEMLKEAGYETRAVMTHWYFEKKKRSGLDQGFAQWKVVGTRWGKRMEDVSTSESVSKEALFQLADLPKDKPWFLWVHFLDPHKWYIFHPGFEARFGNRSIDRYDHEIAFTDHHVGLVLEGLKKEGFKDNTAIIVTSDHGEAFGEHRTAFHGFSIYDVELRVPLLLSVPGHQKAQRISVRRSLIDLTPTLLDLAKVAAPHRLQGQSWLADLEGAALQDRIIYAERPKGPHSAGMRALIEGEWKIIWRGRGNRYELYNLDMDPKELKDRFKQRPEVAKRMVAALVTMQRVALDNQGKVSSR